MLQAIIVAVLQFALPAIINGVVTHQKANNGATPTPADILANTPELAILAQGQAWLATQTLVTVVPVAPPSMPVPMAGKGSV